MTAKVQLARGIDEEVSDVKLTRAKDGSTSTAKFIINAPNCLSPENSGTADITGLFMIDDEGELVTRNVNAKFINGKPAGIEAIYKMEGENEWDRFMRFMDRYAEANDMGFNKKS